MILDVRNVDHQTMSAVIDPFNVLIQLSKNWRISIGVGYNSPIMGGYWMKVEGGPYPSQLNYTRIRLATRDEIVQFEAFKNITTYTALLS